MKILAIRGKNLASLSQAFEVDFTREPLVSCGIFAITGPTGAGKSTLLDALCLALYDNTPRLLRATAKGINLPDVGGETIAPRDTRTLLRRGAADGFAEVDFIGNDQQVYRARWAVRRARNRASGKLQTVEMTLVYLPAQNPVGGKLKTEVLADIEARIGLSFEQFTRAVLLAQNEFAAFLKAPDDERAALLETLTGTEQFAKLSVQAFQRAKQERERVQQAQAKVAALKPLEAQVREALTQEKTHLNASLELITQQQTQLNTHIRWHEQWQQLQHASQQAAQHLTQAQQAKQAASQRMAYFQQVDGIQAARSLVETLDKAELAWQQAEQQANKTQQAVLISKQALTDASEALNQTQAALQAAQQQQLAAQQPLQQAKTLDALIAANLPSWETAKQALEAAQQQVQKVQHEQQQQQATLQKAQHLKQKAQQWLESKQDWRALAEQWGRWDTLLTQAARQQQQLNELAQQLATLHASLLPQQTAVTHAQQQQATVQTQLTQAQQALAKANKQYVQFNPEALTAHKTSLEQQTQLLRQTEQQWQQLHTTQTKHTEAQQRLRLLSAELQDLATSLQKLTDQLPQQEQAYQQAERSWQLAEQACQQSAETMRAALEANSPCPVCGSLEHPYVQENPPLQAVLVSLRAEAKQQRSAWETLNQQYQQQQTMQTLKQQQYAQLQSETQTLQATLIELQTQWTAQLQVLGLEPAVEDWTSYLAQQQAELTAALSQVKAEEQALHLALRQRDQAQQVVNQTQQAYAHITETLTKALQLQRETEQQQAALNQQHNQTQQQLNLVLQQLTSVLGTQWQAQWQNDPAAFQQACARDVDQWLAQQDRYNQADKQCGLLQVEAEKLHALATQAALQWQQAEQRYNHVNTELTAYQTQRRELFAGEAVSVMEATFKQQLVKAQQAVERAQLKQQQVLQAHTQAQAQQQHTQALAQSQQAALTAAQQTLNQWLAVAPFTLDQSELRTLLAHDVSWLKREREVLQHFDTAISNAQALLAERDKALSEHEQQRSSQAALPDLQAELAALTQTLQATSKRVHEIELDLTRDDTQRVQLAAVLVEVEQQVAQARVWEQLNDLIGSADGKKFRNFAQQYSLDVLLSYANRHLQEVARRYRLQRVKESLALVVIDQDLGDETRSVHSLSGGESFLVSLALALGLASLSSHRVKVESLFIDEGFGSLDVDSLQIAMDALDNLQAQGRKVGVISHVQEMTERITVQIRVKRLSGGHSRLLVG